MLVDSIFNRPKFGRKRKFSFLTSIIQLITSLLLFNLACNCSDSNLLTSPLVIGLLLMLIIMGLWRNNTHFHNLKLKNQINEIELSNDELIITNYANEKITVRKDDCILIPSADQVWQLFGRHNTNLLLTLENGSCFYIYKELFNTHQIEDWKSDDANKRYYTV